MTKTPTEEALQIAIDALKRIAVYEPSDKLMAHEWIEKRYPGRLERYRENIETEFERLRTIDVDIAEAALEDLYDVLREARKAAERQASERIDF